MEYLEVRINRTIVTERNAYKTIKEAYLVKAESYTEAETILYKKSEEWNTTWQISRITPSKIGVVKLNNVEDSFMYKVKINEITIVNDNGKKKKFGHYALIEAITPQSACIIADEIAKEWGIDYEIAKVELSKIIGVIGELKTEKPIIVRTEPKPRQKKAKK